tara:strand:- start:27 stop:1385 length:1359 start_codon:yes stop_codon:yes gene_type:complete
MSDKQIKAHHQRNSSIKTIRQLLQQRWFVVVVALILTGFGAAITGVLFRAGVHNLDYWRLQLLEKLPARLVLPLMGGIGGLISSTLITKFAPAASGSGVSHIMAFLRHRPVPMGIKVGFIKLISGIIAIGSGFPLGPEGPSVQMGGSVAWQMAKWLKAPAPFRRVIVAAGGGAGIAAIFSAPIGGFIYAIEELLNSARPVVLLLIVVTTFWADTWADVFQGIGLEPQAGGYDNILGFQLQREYVQTVNFLPKDFVYLIILGVVTGILAELYCRYVLIMQSQGNKWFDQKLILRMTISGLLIGTIYGFLPESFHHLGELKELIAEGNATNLMAGGTFLILFISTGIAAASGAPGGLFYPMLILGGSIGLTCGNVAELITGYVPSSYIFAGMGGFIAGCSRTPITAMFLAFALTKDLLILKPLLICCITSFLIARIFHESSIYERQIQIEAMKN